MLIFKKKQWKGKFKNKNGYKWGAKENKRRN